MSVIPLLTKKQKSLKPKVEGPSDPPIDGEILGHGEMGGLSFRSYKRGVIHLFDKTGLLFKKDADLFEEELEKIKPDSLSEGESAEIPGSGDNCDLILKLENGDVKLSLRKKQTVTMKKLREVLDSLRRT